MRLQIIALLATLALPAAAQDAPDSSPEPAMTTERLSAIVSALDPDAIIGMRTWQMRVGETSVLIVADPDNGRMRAMAPIREADGMAPEELERMMQANFDSALDARYAIAQGILWAAFIQPFEPLEKDQFISGLWQVANLAQSYGTLYSGGALQYGGGDSPNLQRQLIDDLLKKGEEI